MKANKAIIVTLLLVLPAIIMFYALIEPRLIETKKTYFQDDDIPVSFDGKRIVFISDIHLSRAISRERLRDLVKRVNALSPDIILLGGDYIYRGDAYIEPCFEELAMLHAPLGVFAVTGNHDYWGTHEKVEAAMEKSGIKNLNNAAEWIWVNNERIRLGGVGDVWENTPDYMPALAGTIKNDFVVLISHNPDFSETLPVNAVDLQISGHTHGGQVTFFGLWAPLIPSKFGQKYRTGLVENAKTTVLISNGIGEIGVPFRFFARPQINVITLASFR